jgi:hypothetical protein
MAQVPDKEDRMADTTLINQIEVTLVTGNRVAAGSNGDVFLQLGPREFNLRLPPNPTGPTERDKGVRNEYTLGQGANIVNKERNDPRKDLPLKTYDLEAVPAALRFKGQSDDDAWNLEEAVVRAQSQDGEQVWTRMAGNANNLWLGNKFGNVCYLIQTQFIHAG